MSIPKVLRWTICLAIFFTTNVIYGNSSGGSILTYRHLKDSVYEVKLITYRNCKGTPLNLSEPVMARCKTSGKSVTLNMKRANIQDISLLCEKEPLRCNPPNTYGTGDGMEEHVFVDTINFADTRFDTLRSCDEIYFEYGKCCRNSDITTGPSNSNFYNYCMLNRKLAAKNSSPQLNMPPVFYAWLNLPFNYNVALYDTLDFDSVSYAFEPPRTGFGSTVNYSGNYAYNKPFAAYWPGTLKFPYANNSTNPPIGITLDPETGDLIYTPTQNAEITVYTIQTNEWRRDSTGKMNLIGFVRTDFQMRTITPAYNNPPTLNSPYFYKTCAGEKICFNITASDKIYSPPPPNPNPPPDTVRLRWSMNLPGATFEVVNPSSINQTGKFCWVPHDSLARTLPYMFFVEARDNYCPIPGFSRRSFRVQVNPRPAYSLQTENISCNRVAYNLQKDSSFVGSIKYISEILDSNGLVVRDSTLIKFGGANGLSSAQTRDTITFHKSGKYLLSTVGTGIGTSCAVRQIDTLVVNVPEYSLISIENTFHCFPDSIVLKADDYALLNGFRKLTWHTGNIADTLSQLTFMGTKPLTELRVSAIDNNGCEHSDFVRINRYTLPEPQLGEDVLLCGTYSYSLKPMKNTADPRLTYSYVWQDNSKADSFLATKNGNYFVSVSNVCGTVSDTIFITDRNNILKPNADLHFCEDSVLTLKAQIVANKYFWNTAGGEKTQTAVTRDGGKFSCKMILSCGDSVTEYFTVVKEIKPNLFLPDRDEICPGDTVAHAAGYWDANTVWSWNDLNKDSVRRFTTPGLYQFEAANLCGMFEDSILIEGLKFPDINLGSDTLYCQAFTHQLILTGVGETYEWNDSSNANFKYINQAGTFWVKATNQCGSTSDTITIGRSFVPDVHLGADTTITLPFNITLDAGNPGATYLWNTSDTTRTLKVSSTGKYWVKASTPCGQSADTIEIKSTGGLGDLAKLGVKIYPNPNHGKFIIDCIESTLVHVEITDMQGQVMIKKHFPDGIAETEIYSDELKSGVYSIRLEMANGQSAHTVIIITR